MGSAIFNITNGTERYNLLEFLRLRNWVPATPEPRDGGTWTQGIFTDGRTMVSRQLSNIIDTFEFSVTGYDQDYTISKATRVRNLLDEGVRFWSDPIPSSTPVWLEIRGSKETNTRYALVKDYRAPGEGNPFAAPFASCPSMIDIFPLIIEHDIWRGAEPYKSVCVPANNLQEYGSAVTNTSVYVNTGYEDGVSDHDSRTVNRNSIHVIFGNTGHIRGNYLIFRNLGIPKNSMINSAILRFIASGSLSTTTVNVKIYGARDSNPPIPPGGEQGYADLYVDPQFGRTSAEVNWNAIPSWTAGNTYDSPAITTIIQELVQLEDWDEGKDVLIYVEDNSSTLLSFRSAASHDNVSYNPPQLVYGYFSGDYFYGRNDTCLEEVYISNKHNKAQITHAYWYDATGPTWSSQLIGSTFPYQLLPNTPAVGDRFYFGCDTTLTDSGPLSSIVFNLFPPAAGITGLALYAYIGGSWVAVGQYSDKTNAFKKSGVCSYNWYPVYNEGTTSVQGTTGYWYYLEVTGIQGTPTPPYQASRDIYSAVVPFIDIHKENVPGDYPPLARVTYNNEGFAAGLFLYTKDCHVGIRSLDRGKDFSAYLNASNEQNPPGISITLGSYTSIVTDLSAGSTLLIGSATGYVLKVDPNTPIYVADENMRWKFNYNIAMQYRGRYDVYIRYDYGASYTADYYVKARAIAGAEGYWTERKVRLDAGSNEQYLGRLVCWENFVYDDPFWEAGIALHFENTNANPGELFVYDIILIPVDECAVYVDMGVDYLTQTGILDIDSVYNPRVPLRCMHRIDAYNPLGDIYGIYAYSSPGSFVLQPNKDQRIWFYSRNYQHLLHKTKVEIVPRYQISRGIK